LPYDEFLGELLARHFGSDALPRLYRGLEVISRGIGTAVSIDAFIDRFRESDAIATLGKLLIALEIADAERNCIMHPATVADQRFISTPQTADDTWIGSFSRILLDGVTHLDEIGKDITIICFNYDRCIEYYLTETISAAYNVDLASAEEVVGRLNIIHPYGTLGALPTVAQAEGYGVLPFGAELSSDIDWIGIANENIRTYTEQQHEPTTIKRIHDAIAHAASMVFLGFGFNNQNLDLMRVSHIHEYGHIRERNIYSSGVGISPEVETTITRRILHLLWDMGPWHKNNDGRTHVEYGQTCSALFNIHSMNFSSFTRSFFQEVPGQMRSVRMVVGTDTPE